MPATAPTTTPEDRLKLDLCEVLSRYGMHTHAVEVHTSHVRGTVQLALMATDRPENLTALKGTGFQLLAHA